ncbi:MULTISPECIES: hypothetical protein [unclassified Caballeronia]|uniref:hypothetical protein n=1 Tax=unclassified Caballeronia TaxID=2646786 RepID=UPI0020292075|nr:MULTISPECIES: hypothetical protein [unclassified Caballeronia]
MRFAAAALLTVTAAAWADEPPVIVATMGQRVTVKVPAQQTVILDCSPAKGTVADVIGLDGVAAINARIAQMNEAAKPKHR